jgi:hypothetical protein
MTRGGRSHVSKPVDKITTYSDQKRLIALKASSHSRRSRETNNINITYQAKPSVTGNSGTAANSYRNILFDKQQIKKQRNKLLEKTKIENANKLIADTKESELHDTHRIMEALQEATDLWNNSDSDCEQKE